MFQLSHVIEILISKFILKILSFSTPALLKNIHVKIL